VTFILINTLIFLNMVVAVIMDSFQWLYSMESSHDNIQVTSEDLKNFQTVWKTFDSAGSGRIRTSRLQDMVLAAGPPIGRTRTSPLFLRALRAEVAAIPGSAAGYISFRELFLVLTTQMMCVEALAEGEDGDVSCDADRARKVGAVQAATSENNHAAEHLVAVLKEDANLPKASSPDTVAAILNSDLDKEEETRRVQDAKVLEAMPNLAFKDRVKWMMQRHHAAEAVQEARACLDAALLAGKMEETSAAEAHLAKMKAEQAEADKGLRRNPAILDVIMGARRKSIADRQVMAADAALKAALYGELQESIGNSTAVASPKATAKVKVSPSAPLAKVKAGTSVSRVKPQEALCPDDIVSRLQALEHLVQTQARALIDETQARAAAEARLRTLEVRTAGEPKSSSAEEFHEE